MAMTKCKECKKDVSSSANTCPHCGVSNPAMGFKEFVIGLSTLAAIVFGLYFYFSSDSEPKVIKDQPGPIASTPAPAPVIAPDHPKSKKEDVALASDFCMRSSKIVLSEEAAFKKFQTEMNNGQKKGSPKMMVQAIDAYGVRAYELNADAIAVPEPDLSSEQARQHLAQAATSMRTIASNNTQIAGNLRAMLASKQSAERSQEKAEAIGATKDLHTIKYVRAINGLFDSYGFSTDDIDDATLCLKSEKT